MRTFLFKNLQTDIEMQRTEFKVGKVRNRETESDKFVQP